MLSNFESPSQQIYNSFLDACQQGKLAEVKELLEELSPHSQQKLPKRVHLFFHSLVKPKFFDKAQQMIAQDNYAAFRIAATESQLAIIEFLLLRVSPW